MTMRDLRGEYPQLVDGCLVESGDREGHLRSATARFYWWDTALAADFNTEAYGRWRFGVLVHPDKVAAVLQELGTAKTIKQYWRLIHHHEDEGWAYEVGNFWMADAVVLEGPTPAKPRRRRGKRHRMRLREQVAL